jgi:hypothetical protein
MTNTQGAAAVEKGDTRWTIGVALAVLGGVLALCVFGTFATLTYSASNGSHGYLKVTDSINGFGSVTVSVPGLSSETERRFVARQEKLALEAEAESEGASGGPILLCALVIGGAAIAFLQNRRREAALIAALGSSAIALLVGLWRLSNPRGLFGDPAGWDSARVSAGFALIIATFVALVTLALSVTAYIIERRSLPSSPMR